MLKWLILSILVVLLVMAPVKESSVKQVNSVPKPSKLRNFTNKFLKRLEEV